MESLKNKTSLRSFISDLYKRNSDEEYLSLLDQLEDILSHMSEMVSKDNVGKGKRFYRSGFMAKTGERDEMYGYESTMND